MNTYIIASELRDAGFQVSTRVGITVALENRLVDIFEVQYVLQQRGLDKLCHCTRCIGGVRVVLLD